MLPTGLVDADDADDADDAGDETTFLVLDSVWHNQSEVATPEPVG